MQEAEVLVEQGDLLQQVSVASMAGGMILMGIPISILFYSFIPHLCRIGILANILNIQDIL